MAQIFHRSFNTISRVTIFGAVFFLVGLGYVVAKINRSAYMTEVDVAVDQSVPFSHQHHVGGLGIDCRYCHTSVEKSAVAGMPPTKTCMNCHSQIWAKSPMLKPVRDSYQTGESLAWNKVHRLPDFVYFNHAIHVKKGVGCVTCHGRIDRMPLVSKAVTLHMEWCLDCHREPEKFVRPRDKVFDMAFQPEDQLGVGRKLVKEYGIKNRTDCSTCHR